MHNPAAVLENETKTPMGLWRRNESPNIGDKTLPYSNQQKKERDYAKLLTLLYRLTTEEG